MDDVTWTIVQFTEDKTVEAIPTSWIQGDFCHWPPYKQKKLKNSIKKCEALNTSWPKHKIKIFRNATFGEYGKVRNKARLAEDCSDLNSENESSTKRKRIQKILSSSSEESMDESAHSSFKLPKPPKLSQSSSIFTDSDIPYLNHNTNKVTTILKSPSASTVTDEGNINEPSTSTKCCLQHEHKILIEIKNQIHMLRGILIDIHNEVKHLKTTPELNSVQNSLFVKYPDIIFPIGSYADMMKFEEELRNKDNFTEAVNEIAQFGGSNPYNFLKRTLSSLIKDEVLITYSWLGRKRLEASPIAKLLISAANKLLHSFNPKQIEEAIQSFLKRCGERISAKENKKT